MYFDNSESQHYTQQWLFHNRFCYLFRMVYRRIVALDVARGLAILGTLLTNIAIFASTSDDLFSTFFPERSIAGEAQGFIDGSNDTGIPFIPWLIESLLYLITDGKFLGLLTIMFGIGVEIQRQSRQRQGLPWPGGYMWRAGILVIEGLLNYIFIFEFDVLMGYGLTALAVAPILARSEQAQKRWMIVGISIHVFVMTAFAVIMILLNNMVPLEEQGTEALGTEDLGAVFATDSYWDMVQRRAIDIVGGRMEVAIMFFMGIGVFLLGARLYRAGLFQPDGAALRRKVMFYCFGIGLPVDWGLRIFTINAFPLTRYVTSTVVAFGLLALIAWFYVKKGNALGVAGKPIAAVGRMALTCYVLQNVVASIIFYDFGFGVARLIDGPHYTYWVLLIFALMSLFLVLLSVAWLSKFERGPLEMVMRMAYGPLSQRRDARILRKQAQQFRDSADHL